jgi:ribosome maturation factor RimP
VKVTRKHIGLRVRIRLVPPSYGRNKFTGTVVSIAGDGFRFASETDSGECVLTRRMWRITEVLK